MDRNDFQKLIEGDYSQKFLNKIIMGKSILEQADACVAVMIGVLKRDRGEYIKRENKRLGIVELKEEDIPIPLGCVWKKKQPALDELDMRRDRFDNGALVPYQGAFGRYY
jgi:hypothetical protein|tara:strand:+ start:592 stop:921 length:330 start_codon:yes stop_codon:yes gene_type:complete